MTIVYFVVSGWRGSYSFLMPSFVSVVTAAMLRVSVIVTEKEQEQERGRELEQVRRT